MGRKFFQITDENFYECIEVSKQIFWMYHDIASNWGIVHNIDFEKVNYEKYIMCEIIEERLKIRDLECIVKVVNQGCFAALSCYVLNLMDEDIRDSKVIKFIDSLLEDERINDMEFEKELLISMNNALKQSPTYKIDKNIWWANLPDGRVFNEKLQEVYTNYVKGYYETMLKSNEKQA